MATSLQQSGIVVGYFATGHAAHRAIQALVDDGFLPTEIGAAFHVGSTGETGSAQSEAAQPNVGGSLREELGTTIPSSSTHGGRVGTSSAASDSSAVQYASLGGGAGTPFDGAGRPGPISGSSLVNTGLPSELKSELPHDAGLPHDSDLLSAGGAVPQSQSSSAPGSSISTTTPVARGGVTGSAQDYPSAGSLPTTAQTTQSRASLGRESWTEKLKHLFTPSRDEAKSRGASAFSTAPAAPVTKESQDFGTGEGHLMLNTGMRYSQPAFERSFSNYGVQPEHARTLSQRIGRSGAVVTVHAAARAMEAERLLEAHGGEVRFGGDVAYETLADESEVEVFGTVGRDYPGYFD